MKAIKSDIPGNDKCVDCDSPSEYKRLFFFLNESIKNCQLFLYRSRLGQHQLGSADLHRVLRCPPKAGLSHLPRPLPRFGRVASGSPLRHDGAGQPSGQLCLGGPLTHGHWPQAWAQLQPGGQGAVHHDEIREEGVPRTSLGCQHLIRFTPIQRHLQVKYFWWLSDWFNMQCPRRN